jgi:hypothetical protein
MTTKFPEAVLRHAPTVALAYIATVSAKQFIETPLSKSLATLIDIQDNPELQLYEQRNIRRVFQEYKKTIDNYVSLRNTQFQSQFSNLQDLFSKAENFDKDNSNIIIIDLAIEFLQYMHLNGYYFKK